MTACAQVPVPPTHATDNFLSIDGTRLRYRDEGRGPAVLLVHGWTLDLEMWDPQVSALRGTFRLIRLDRRGHGLSEGTSTPERDSEDLERLSKHLGLTRVALIGMSQGVRGVLGFACAAPGRVSALILDGPPALDSESDPEVPVQQYAALVHAHGMATFRREWARHRLMQLRTRDPVRRALVAAMIERYAGNDLQSPPSGAELIDGARPEAVAAPTLVLSGELDLPGRRLAARRLAARLSDAELAIISGAAHLPNLDSPDVYSKLCRAFLLRHCGSRGLS
jgi:pimeloyl-[acyl-carrier protein] methyl ester esterase